MRFPKTPRLVFVFVVTGELLGLNVPARGERPPDRPIRTRTLIAEKDAKIAQLSDVLTKKVEQEQDLMKINGLLNANLAQAKAPLYQKYLQAQIAYYDHEMAMWKISELLYQWQQKASNVVMSLVCIVVLAGISFSGLQLWKAVTSGGPQDKTELEISANRVRLTSSVVGIAVLAISLGFSYLFVVYVYQITTPPDTAPIGAVNGNQLTTPNKDARHQ